MTWGKLSSSSNKIVWWDCIWAVAGSEADGRSGTKNRILDTCREVSQKDVVLSFLFLQRVLRLQEDFAFWNPFIVYQIEVGLFCLEMIVSAFLAKYLPHLWRGLDRGCKRGRVQKFPVKAGIGLWNKPRKHRTGKACTFVKQRLLLLKSSEGKHSKKAAFSYGKPSEFAWKKPVFRV